jgi:DNA-binding protein H-NS
LSELSELERSIPREIRRRKAEERQQVRREVEAFVKSRGFSLDDLQVGNGMPMRKRPGTLSPKYRHPQKPDLTWTGRGRKPKWVEAWLAEGGSFSALEI